MTIKTILLGVYGRAVNHPQSTAVGCASLATLFAPHLEAAKLIAVLVFVFGLLSTEKSADDPVQK